MANVPAPHQLLLSWVVDRWWADEVTDIQRGRRVCDRQFVYGSTVANRRPAETETDFVVASWQWKIEVDHIGKQGKKMEQEVNMKIELSSQVTSQLLRFSITCSSSSTSSFAYHFILCISLVTM